MSKHKLTKRQMVRKIQADDKYYDCDRTWFFWWDYYKLLSVKQLKNHLPAYPVKRLR